MKHLVVLTGAGMSAESGLKTFRDANGLWEGHDVMEVASPEGFAVNPELVLEFYNQRRRQLLDVKPNKAHLELANLEKYFKITIITQNVDDLHERAGSTNVIHLHGELFKVRSTKNKHHILDWKEDLNLGDLDQICQTADKLLIIGTSLQVYPAASLMHYVPEQTPTYFIDPNPSISSNKYLTVIPEKATKGIGTFIKIL